MTHDEQHEHSEDSGSLQVQQGKLRDIIITCITSFLLAGVSTLIALEFRRAQGDGVTKEWRRHIEEETIYLDKQVEILKANAQSAHRELESLINARADDRFRGSDFVRERQILVLEITKQIDSLRSMLEKIDDRVGHVEESVADLEKITGG